MKNFFKKIIDWSNKRLDLTNLAEIFLSFSGLLYGELDRRLELHEALQKALKKPVPKHVNFSFCFGGITFLLFLIQVFTGILLALYYRPSPEAAYESVRHITNDVTLGWLIRGVHRWASTLMIIFVIFHTLRVFLTGVYKPPRELNWMVGVCLFGVTLIFGFTGYLLPWDQLAYWATTVGTEIAGGVPIIGDFLLLMMRGGKEVSGETLTRFFTGHVIILPLVVFILLGLHFLMVRRQGISGPL
ncbi:MAG: cytochrome b N-terminal domain-containing protein [Armatimonadetes bacterium]|nr:cytochrome b N-terminal domain-containing protein [Armatimonadota bacterium]